MEKIEKEALAIQAGPKDPKDYLVQELDVLLKWHQVPMKDVPGKQKKIAKWSEIMVSTKPRPPYQKWTADDEARLSLLKTSSIEVRDTALGRHRETKKRELLASIALMTEQEATV